MIAVGFALPRATPNAEDVVEGFDASSREELERASQRFGPMIEDIPSPHATALVHSGLAPAELADRIQRPSRAAKMDARGRSHLLNQLESLKKLCIAAAVQPA